MKILILGAAGMLGRKLLASLAGDGWSGPPISEVVLHDISAIRIDRDFPFRISALRGDGASREAAQELIAVRPDVIFHLASIVSGEAEANFEEGYRVNLDGARHLFDAIRAEPDYRPRLVFTSSLAVFGGPYPDMIGDDFLCAPQSSYGTQKAIVELMLADYSRRGFLDGVALRLPTICVRPGAPNAALSGFFSNIIREPLNGRPAVLPVADNVRHWIASPRCAVVNILHAARIASVAIGDRRSLNLPGLSVSVAEQLEALRRVGGEAALDLIQRKPDPAIAKIVGGWPQSFTAERALKLGFRADPSFDQILSAFIEDDLEDRSRLIAR